MVINFLNPLYLLLIPVLIVFVVYTQKKLIHIRQRERLFQAFIRSLIFSLLILALAGASIRWKSNIEATLYLIDCSDSMVNSKEETYDFLKNALKQKSKKDLAGVIAFGEDAKIEAYISDSTVFDEVQISIKSRYTDIENSILKAISMFPKNSKKRIVLVSDGKENKGDSSRIASLIKSEGIDFKVKEIKRDTGNEVLINSLILPSNLNVGEAFTIKAEIESTVNTKTKLKLFQGTKKVSEEEIKLSKGKNNFIFKDTVSEEGFYDYTAFIEPEIDTIRVNNQSSALLNVFKKPTVLLVTDSEKDYKNIENILISSNQNYKKVSAGSVPQSLSALLAYKSIILCNISADELSTEFLDIIESYVGDFGGGIVAIGGEDSFALGGYYKTSLEKVLPVNMDMKGKKEIPDTAIMLVIDKSGSMGDKSGGITKLDIAKAAASMTLDSLTKKDEIGVIAFDDTIYTVVDLQKNTDSDTIKDNIGTIRSGGGTSIIPALSQAYDEIKKSSAKIKHILLLTDGQAEKTGYLKLLNNIKAEGITVSTVAVGEGADKALLQSIASGAFGRFYYTDQFDNIPRIFAKETFIAKKAYLNNREFTPVVIDNHAILSDVSSSGFPTLFGYIGASYKDGARVLLSSDEDDPILTLWQYGLGRTVAWNSDMSGQWSRNFLQWEKNLILWQNIINYTIGKEQSEVLKIETKLEGDTGIVNVKALNQEDILKTNAKVVTPSLKTIDISLNPIAKGNYTGSFETSENGVYLIQVVQSDKDNIINQGKTGLSVDYSPEYSLVEKTNTLERLVENTNGVFVDSPKEVYEGYIMPVFGDFLLTPWLIMISLLLFIFDIVIRKLNLSFEVKGKRLIKKEKQQNMNEYKKVIEVKKTSREDEILDTELLLNKKNKK